MHELILHHYPNSPCAEKARLLQEVRNAIEQPDAAQLRPEWQRGL